MKGQKNTRLEANRNIGSLLYKRRNDKGVTQEAVADVLDIHRQSYANIESGKAELTILKAIRLADYFHVSIDELVGHQAEKPKEISEPRAPYIPEPPQPTNIIFQIGAEGTNSPEAEAFLKSLGKFLSGEKPMDTD